MNPKRDPVQNFWSKVKKDPSHPTGCWEWTAGLNRGYGQFPVRGDKNYRAHRFAWSIIYGAIPPNKFVLHRCDNRKCVRPNHLFIGTQRDNVQDAIVKGRRSSTQGEANGSAKLTNKQVLKMRRWFSQGKTLTYLAKEFRVKVPTVHGIIHRKRWKHI